jgi:hypothetical protein
MLRFCRTGAAAPRNGDVVVRSRLYAGNSEYPAVLALVTSCSQGGRMGSDNPSGADNQQERLKLCGWTVGFVDGEGCFSCSISKIHGGRPGGNYNHGLWLCRPPRVVEVLTTSSDSSDAGRCT